jgi:hypothetical protein
MALSEVKRLLAKSVELQDYSDLSNDFISSFNYSFVRVILCPRILAPV